MWSWKKESSFDVKYYLKETWDKVQFPEKYFKLCAVSPVFFYWEQNTIHNELKYSQVPLTNKLNATMF